jgi:alkylhydroperoxidase/carboxymuconolactone decarboxylase family protein YurZ
LPRHPCGPTRHEASRRTTSAWWRPRSKDTRKARSTISGSARISRRGTAASSRSPRSSRGTRRPRCGGTSPSPSTNGVKPREISEIITHLAFYSGWGNAISAVAAAKEVFAERSIGPEQLPAATVQPLPLDEATEAQRASRVAGQYGAAFPGIVQYTTDVLFRDLWLRPDLAPRDRSLVTVSALVASGQVAQIPYHLNKAMDNGLTQKQAAEAVTHLAFYAGWPNAFSALPVAKDVFEKRGK